MQGIKSEKWKVCEYAVKGRIVSVGRGAMQLKEHGAKNFQEVLVTDASVENLFYENFLIRVFELHGQSGVNLL